MGRFEDERGVIQDLIVAPLTSVTRITTKAGAIRGNHLHAETRQWTYMLGGELEVYDSDGPHLLLAGMLWLDEPKEPHAWRAITDCECLVFTDGPRSGENYVADTFPVHPPLVV